MLQSEIVNRAESIQALTRVCLEVYGDDRREDSTRFGTARREASCESALALAAPRVVDLSGRASVAFLSHTYATR